MRRLIRIVFILLLLPPSIAAFGGWLSGPTFLHPPHREFTAADVKEADVTFSQIGAQREDFDVRARDGILLRGWKVRPEEPNGSWVLVFHGVADNRMGVMEQAVVLLRAGYSVIMMDARVHGASEGSMATYGWLERNDSRAIVDALFSSEHFVVTPKGAVFSADTVRDDSPLAARVSVGTGLAASSRAASQNAPLMLAVAKPAASVVAGSPGARPIHIFALGESMGAGIALQSAGADPRIEAVVAEASFSSIREASYDYAGLQKYPLLGKTFFAPGAWMMIYHGQKLAGFQASEVSPEKAVASRSFPVLLICDGADTTLPCRHSEKIFAAAMGPKEIWEVPDAFHTGAIGYQPAEFRRRVVGFFEKYNASSGK